MRGMKLADVQKVWELLDKMDAKDGKTARLAEAGGFSLQSTTSMV